MMCGGACVSHTFAAARKDDSGDKQVSIEGRK
jgi:hypothetical protein